MTCKDSAFNKRRNSRKVFVGRHNKDHLIDSRMRTKYILNFFNVFSYNINPGKIHCAFFPLKKLARLFLLKEVKPSPDRKMLKPLSFENLFPPLRYSRLNSFKERRLPLFPAIMTLVYARALLSIEIIGRLRCHDGNSNVRKRHKSNRFRLAYQQLSTAHASRFFVHCFAVNARLRRELPNFYVSSIS